MYRGPCFVPEALPVRELVQTDAEKVGDVGQLSADGGGGKSKSRQSSQESWGEVGHRADPPTSEPTAVECQPLGGCQG